MKIQQIEELNKLYNYENLVMVNITNDNNFYVSKDIIENIEEKMKPDIKMESVPIVETMNLVKQGKLKIRDPVHTLLFNEEIELLNLYKLRIENCKNEKMNHYFILGNNYSDPYSITKCYYCEILLTEYCINNNKKEKTK